MKVGDYRAQFLGVLIDGSGVNHGYVRTPKGAVTTFDVPGAGIASGQGTLAEGINPVGTIPGNYIDGSSVNHGFVRDSTAASQRLTPPARAQT